MSACSSPNWDVILTSILFAGEAPEPDDPPDLGVEDFGVEEEGEEGVEDFGVEPFPDDPLLCRFCKVVLLSVEIGTATAEAVSASVRKETILENFIIGEILT
jgi:hypothetical protein